MVTELQDLDELQQNFDQPIEENEDQLDSDAEWIDSDDAESNYSEEEGEEDDYLINNADQPLYPGSPITVAEHVLSMLSLMMHFPITGALFARILKLIYLHCIRPNHCLKTVYKFKKLFSDIKTPLVRHYYCTVCFKKRDSQEDQECADCKKRTASSYFLEISIFDQLQKFYKRKGFKEMLTNRFTRIKVNDSNFEDIYDGSIYKELINKGFFL